jgi:hypothetical protein
LIDLVFLDQSGFSRTLPTGYSWIRRGKRLRVDYRAPQGQRVNVVGAYAPYRKTGPRLLWESRRSKQGKYDGWAHLAFLFGRVAGFGPGEELSRLPRPLVIVLDNYSVHHSEPVKLAQPYLAAANIFLFYLPTYSPELNLIEPLWRELKYHDLQDRSYETEQLLQEAVEGALEQKARQLAESSEDLALAA